MTSPTNRDDLIARYACPRCKAPAGTTCTGARGQERRSQHEARWNAAGVTLADLRERRFGPN